ncbi:restriction endonuclease subunit S [Winogradskyella ouciana]|uniref:restriction endonuclease subunit S n=1 Tax=Winogradskyella ouciana TaxID=2608631 RepID=UPI003D2C61C5
MGELTAKKYKKTDLGIIPCDWNQNEVGNCFLIHNNLRLPISGDIRKSIQGPYPYYGPTKIQDYINEYRVDGTYALIGEDGDHFLKWKNESMTQLAKGRFNVNNHAHLLKGKNDETTTEWFYYFFKHRDITPYLARQGAGRYKLSKSALITLPCVYPSIKEQKLITEVLYDTDTLIQALEKKIVKNKLIKKGVMQKLLTPKNGWRYIRLGDIASMNSGGTPLTINAKFYDGDIVWVSISDISGAGKYISNSTKKISEQGLNNSSARIFNSGTVLLAMYASIGKCCIATRDVTTSQAILGITTSEKLYNEYLYYYLIFKVNDLISQGQQGTQSNLNKGIVEDYQVHLPEFDEQVEIANTLRDIDDEIDVLEQKLSKYQLAKQGMMQQLLTGKIRLV